ncbi:MAG: type I restriction enzyme HsdR N-terminal domain-containing protein [Sphingomonadales bacterium]|nr:type I restriction enzyme HsdR N-terminal domain-containing protein [Sphingomonadales bacterium]
MALLQALNLPKAALKLNSKAGRIYIHCLLRKKPIVLTPEEWVRQHLIAYLHHHLGYPMEKMAIEKEIQFDGFIRRWDLVVFDQAFQAHILLECKAPQIPISHEVFMQIANYQSKIQAPFLILSNGLTHLIYQVNFEQKILELQTEFPKSPNKKA